MTLSDLQRLAVKEAYAAYFRVPTAAQKAAAKEIIADCEAPATAVMIAAKHLLGPMFLAYEPETLWHELDPCANNRDKLMAAIALSTMPSFYWDYRVFGATTDALNHEAVHPEQVPHNDPGQMAWAAFEAELLFALTDEESTKPEFDDPVAAYVAVVLNEAGYVVPPVGLGFADGELKSKIGPDAGALRAEVAKAWAELPKDAITEQKFDDSALGVQLFKLTSSWLYVEEQVKKLRAAVARL